MNIKERVQNGIRVLDETYPEWWKLIDPEQLNIDNEFYCVVGQIFGKYSTGMKQLGLLEGYDYGFLVGYYRDQKEIHQEWKKQIYNRKYSG